MVTIPTNLSPSKIGIPDIILNKRGRLSESEYETMKTHTTIGKQICEPLQSMTDIIDIIYLHHERWDGRGYPLGLSGDKIPLMSQIVSIIDFYDAITSTRPYRDPFSHDGAIKILRSERGKSFKSELVDNFITKGKSFVWLIWVTK